MLPLIDLRNERARVPAARAQKTKTEQFAVVTCADHPEFFEASVELENEVWDALSFLDFTAAHHAHYDHLMERFPECRLCMVDRNSGELAATSMAVPLRILPGAPLPPGGWDWIVETARSQNGNGANALGALSISVPLQHRDKGLAREMIDSMLTLAAVKRLERLIAPVRPSAKSEHPYVPMAEYIDWVDDRGRIFDPWLRSHAAVGGQVMGVCDRSMIVEQPLDFWRPWTGAALDQDGRVPFKGALTPLEVLTGSDTGRYIEPNVWVQYSV
jgi:hypothetical protein